MPHRPLHLKIVHVVDSLEVGGLERVVCDLAQAQRQVGHEASVFSISSTDGLRQELIAAGVPVVVGHKQRSMDLGVLRKLRQAATGADIVHAHNFVPNYYSAVALLGTYRPPTQVCTCHDMGTRLRRSRLRWMFRLSLLRTARVAMVGRQVHTHYLTANLVADNRAQTVMNGVRTERFISSMVRRQSARETLALAPTDLVIGCVGRLVSLKNHQMMIAVMPALLQRFPNLKLVVVGDGPLAPDLRNQVANLGLNDQVILSGPSSNVSDLLPAFDIYALPSLTEGLSISLLEAAATGLPIVATEVGGNPEVIVHDKTGLLVPAADGDALLNALSSMIENPEKRHRLGHDAQKWVNAHGSINALRQSYDDLYTTAMQSSRRR